MIAVVKKEDDFSANFLLETSRRENFRDQIPFRKKSARLLAETDDRTIHSSAGASCQRGRLAAKDSLLQDRRHDHHRRGPGDTTNEKRCEKQTEYAAVEQRAQDVSGFDEVLHQTGK